METELIPIESVNAIELFNDRKSIETLLLRIKKEATDFKPNPETDAGRKEIASQAYKVSRSKTVIDSAGKALTDEWAKKKKLVDESRKLVRDFCDNLRDEIRKPLTAWEAEQERLAAEKAAQLEYEADYLEAVAMDELFNRERAVREAEARIEAERLAKEAEAKAAEEARLEKERIERIEKEAAERATREAAEKLRLEKERADKAEQDRLDAIERERIQVEQAEQRRVEAEKKAEQEKQEAIENQKRIAQAEADRVERERLRLIEENEREAQARAADTENRRKVNNTAVAALVAGGITEKAAKAVVVLIASGKIPSVSIRY